MSTVNYHNYVFVQCIWTEIDLPGSWRGGGGESSLLLLLHAKNQAMIGGVGMCTCSLVTVATSRVEDTVTVAELKSYRYM